MLKDLNADQARFVALLAKAARAQRDAMLGHVPDKDLDGVTVARGEHSPTAALGLEPLLAQDTQLSALRDALAALTEGARSELGAVAGLVGNEGGVVSEVINLESSGVEAPDRRPRHDDRYHET